MVLSAPSETARCDGLETCLFRYSATNVVEASRGGRASLSLVSRQVADFEAVISPTHPLADVAKTALNASQRPVLE